MRYNVANSLELFEFHDAYFSFISFNGADLTVSAEMVNIHKHAEQNPYDWDMEIEQAQIIFRSFHSPTYEPGRTWETDKDGTARPVGPQVVFSAQDAMDRILKELGRGFTVYGFSKNDDGSYGIEGSGLEPFFHMTFSFDRVETQWDTYKKKAWYELHKQYQHRIKVGTPNGTCDAELRVIYHMEDVYFQGKKQNAPIICVGITYENQEFWGRSQSDILEAAYADLQNILPAGVFLKCCLTCRHGNMCPYCNGDTVYCTKEHTVTSKDDVCELFNQMAARGPGEMNAHQRYYGDFCESYLPQDDGHYTYNDYTYYLT